LNIPQLDYEHPVKYIRKYIQNVDEAMKVDADRDIAGIFRVMDNITDAIQELEFMMFGPYEEEQVEEQEEKETA